MTYRTDIPVGISNEEISVAVHGYLGGSSFHVGHVESLINELHRLNNRTAMDLARVIHQAAPTQRIQNVKTLRERCSMGLKEAVDMMHQAEAEALEARLLELVNQRHVILTTFQTINPLDTEPPF